MKKILFTLGICCIFASSCYATSLKDFLKKAVKVYKQYEEVNLALWLVGDTGAEKRLGQELAMWQKLTSKPDTDQNRVNRVKNIFNRLTPQFNSRGMGFRVTVLRDNTINAFVIPGGNVYVYSGICDYLQSDDELAAVISHELAHAERRHSLKNFRTSTVLVALLKKACKNMKNQELWTAVLSSLALMKFSRTQEDEADDIGQFRMAAAGFDPGAQVSVWERFLSQSKSNNSRLQQLLSSHPTHQQRIDNAKKNLAKMNYQK